MQRNKSLDLLRILSIWFILTVHFLGWGGAVNTLTIHDVNYFWVMPIYFFSQIGNTLFFILAGYFAGQPKLNKGILLWRKTAFYSTVITWIVFFLGGVTLSYTIRSMFPLLFKKYWFISVYLVLYTLELFLVPGLRGLTKCQYFIILLALLLNNTLNDAAQYTLMEGLLAFMIGFYVRLYKPFKRIDKKHILFLYFIVMLLYSLERLTVLKLGIEHGKWDVIFRYAILLIASVLLFCFFEQLEIKWKWPSVLAPNILSIYLITANPAITNLLYVQFLQISEFSNKAWFFMYYIVINTFAFAFCLVIDKLVTKINLFESKILINAIRKMRL